ncbi:mRNA cleavage factor complex II protein Clp1 [Zymoseptoria brevis]|uniref:Polynucleotide 5'-hydroxyl-kinase GRC3 n=1 Tax=Zymoseptoria brevis TaxID=1047168 RepID=A0A0F4G5H1_9PEZI|nr:mRNA cleavage factor complex II protein Clp1 [Zymoseptoria brevis]
MALPGLSLPGLNLPQTSSTPLTDSKNTIQASRLENLPSRTEWRFEVAFSQHYSIKLESGHAEMFGVELALKQVYTFSGFKGAIFTWQGCQLEVTGNAESEYIGQETDYAVEWLNVHGMLDTLRSQNPTDGPRVLVVGPDFVGKTSLVRSLAAWGARSGYTPTVLNLDPREGILAPPSSLTAVTVDSQLEVDSGYGIPSSSGPTLSPVRTPLIYHFPYASPLEKPEVYKAVVTRMALSVMNKLEENQATKRGGIIVDTPGTLNDPRSNYDLIAHLVSELSITVILTLGSERLSSDMTRRFGGNKSPDEMVTVLRVAKPGGAVERDHDFMKQLNREQTRQYFFGPGNTLNPHSHSASFAELDLFRAKSASVAASEDHGFAPGDENDDDFDVPYASKPSGGQYATFEKTTPTAAMTGSLVAIKFCTGSSEEYAVRDSAVMGILYVADVDEVRKKVRFLAPHPQRWGDRALVWGHGWPEAVADLVA